MMLSNWLKRLACVTLASFLPWCTGCASLDALLGERKPSARVVNVNLKDLSLDSATILFDMEVDNPYSVPLPLGNVDYGLASGGAPFLSGKASLQGTVPAQGKKVVSVPARLSYLELVKAVKGVRPGTVVPYRADIGLSVDAPVVGAMRLPLSTEGQLPVPAVPELEVETVTWDRMGLDEASGRFKLRIVNPNPFPLDLVKLQYAFSLGGVEVANSSLVKAVAFAPDGGAGTVEIPLSFAPKQFGLAVFSLIAGKGAGYKLAGGLDVQTPYGPLSLPIEKAGDTTFRN